MRSIFIYLFCLSAIPALAQETPFQSLDDLPDQQPWTHLNFVNDPEEFQFAIVGDRTGGHRPGIFEKGVDRLNLLQPEFVMCVGDLIEGYSRDSLIVNEQWSEFASLIDPLEAPFFFLPGNHDVSNEMMQRQWIDRYGTTYYSFVYHDVLFIAMDSNDGDGVSLSGEQIAYVTNAIEQHPDVRWTLLFMHHPIWQYQDVSGFQEIEKALDGRKYTVIAGHKHHYFYETRNNRNYYVLATTGGGSRMRGPRFGEFDHITWVTMTKDQGPVMVHLQLDGMWHHDVVTAEWSALSQELIKSTEVRTELFYPGQGEQQNIQALLLFQNDADRTLTVDARFFHHHQVEPSESVFEFTVPAHGKKQIPITLQPKEHDDEALEPLQLQWTMHYEADSLNSMSLDGVYDIFLDTVSNLSFQTDQKKFLESTEVSIDFPFEEAQIRYTTDGSDPLENGKLYTAPITLEASAEVKAVAVWEGQTGGVVSERFEKVKLLKPEKVRKKQQGLHYAYYEGEWKKVPDFAALEPAKTGVAPDLDIMDIAGDRENYFAIRYQGYVQIPADGLYTFYVTSDDGSKLYLHDQLVVDNDGSHSTRTREGTIALKKGLHPIDIQYFEDFDGERLDVYMEGADMERQKIPSDHLFTE